MDFQDVEIGTLVKFISEITGRNFIIDDRIKGKITIISPSKIDVDEAYAVFQSVLQVKGFTTVPSGPIIKILPAGEAKTSTVDTVFPGGAVSLTDEFVTELMKLEYVDVSAILAIVQPLVSSNGLLAAYPETNTLIIIDAASNIARVGRIIRVLDVEGSERGLEVLRLNYAFAGEIAALIAQVMEDPASSAPAPARASNSRSRASTNTRARGQAGRTAASRRTTAPQQTTIAGGTGQSAFKIIPDERTNSLIVVAGTIEMRRIKELTVQLDVPIPFGTGRIHVYYLRFANAFEIVPILSDLIGGSGGGLGGVGGGLLGRSLSGSTAARGGRLGQRGGLAGGLSGSGRASQREIGGLTNSAFGGSRSQRGSGGLGGGFGGGGRGGFGGGGASSISGGGGGEFEGEIRITADPSTNSLIINASPQDFETLKRVIEKLDVRRRQVYIEAMILELRLDVSRQLGIELQGATSLGDSGVGFGRTNFGSINNSIFNPASIGGLILAAASNQTIRLPDGSVVPAQTAVLTASQGNADINILSAPNILTTDNEEAEIVVGQNIPFVASRSTSETNLANTFATVERRDVGITLRITPQISEGGMVRLDLFEEVSAVIPQAISGIDPGQLGPATTIRSATTSVVVRDKHTVVIGGLISDDISNIEQGVPYLSSIPFIGNLLTQRTSERRKVNLMIFLTPYIIRDSIEHRDFSLEQRGRVESFMGKHGFRNRRRAQLDTPNWDPDLPPREDPDDEDDGRPSDDALDDSYARGFAERSDAQVSIHGRDIEPIAANGYVVLAQFAEWGTPPSGLDSASGMLALSMSTDSALAGLFRKGNTYRFEGATYTALYQCLEAYPSAQQALMLYPEGFPVDAEQGDYLHWYELNDPVAADARAWSQVE